MCTNGSNVYLNTLSILTALKQANDDHSYDQSISVLGVLGVLSELICNSFSYLHNKALLLVLNML